jgi:hypothetical protein
MSSRLTIQFIGSESDKEDVRLNDFIDQLRNIKKALRETEMALSGRPEPTLDYRIVDLRHSSPSTVVLEAVDMYDQPTPAQSAQFVSMRKQVVGAFTDELRLIRREKKLLIEPDLPRLVAYQDIGRRENTHSRIEKVKFKSGRVGVTIDKTFQRNLNDIVGPDEFAEGQISGMLEALNFHNANKFTLYPAIGPKKIAGTFDPKLRPAIKEAIGSFVTVVGKLRYKAWSPYPHGVIAQYVDVHQPDSELPTLSQLRGAFAGVTGKLNSAEFIDQLRHED